ncbi:hypothetical protein Tco_0586005 [Tanacetum coccineum]
MAKGQPKKKKARKDVFTVNLHFDGIFTSWPLKYAQSQLTLGLREIKSTQDIAEMIKVGYESGNEIDMYVEHFGYDIMELIKLETEGDESVVIKSISTHDPFLTKLCSARIMFRGTAEHLQTEEPLADPDDHQIHAVNKVQSGVLYPAFDPDIPWDKMEPTLEMWKKEDVLVKKVIKIGCGKVENADNWGWFLHLLHDDLSLNDGNRITIIYDSHKRLSTENVQGIYMPISKEIQWTPISKTFLGCYILYFRTTVYANHGSAFENGISESFNRAILEPRHKPIITMLEEIREWLVIPSGFQELEVRKDD